MADPAEVLALRVLVMALVAAEAHRYEQSGGGPAQSMVNNLSAVCQEAVIEAKAIPDRLRAPVLEHINSILGSIGFPRQSDDAN
jgi:hypothetical protein